jgi:oxygen-dependent protoporphyrinogen oxidase
MKVETIIIGAGISGLSTAHFLSKKSNDFLLIESEKNVGGIISTEKKSGFLCENGPNTVLLNNDAIEELIKDCGLFEDIIFPNEKAKKNRFVFHQSKIQALPSSPLQIFTTPLLSFWDKIKFLLEPSKPTKKENVSVKEFFDYRFSANFTNQFIEPFLTGIYAGNIEKMSMKHALKKVWNLEQENGSLLKGLMKNKGSKKQTPIFNFKNGLSQLTEKIKHNLEDKILINHSVNSIKKTKEGYQLIINEKEFSCKNIISTIPAFSLAKLIGDKNLIEELNKVRYAPAEVFHFGFKKKEIKKHINGFGLLTKASDKKSFLGVLFNSEIFQHVSSADSKLFTVIVGGERQAHLCDLAKDQLQKLIESELKELIQTQANPYFSNHYSYKKGIPQYLMNHQKLLDSIQKFEQENKNFLISGNYIKGVSVSDCIQNAKRLVNNTNLAAPSPLN